MVHIFRFPDIGEGIHEGKILEWHVSRGQPVKEGDLLVKVETDKVVADIPAPRDGIIKNLFGKVGQVINVGDVLAEFEIDADLPPRDETPHKPIEKEPFEEPGFGVVGVIEVAHTDAFLPATGEGLEDNGGVAVNAPKRRVLASPVARKMARDLGVDLGSIKGTGPLGRVMKEDLRAAMQSRLSPAAVTAPPAASLPPFPLPAPMPDEPRERVEYEELSQIRKTIVQRMVQSKFTAPHLTAHEEVEVSRLVQLRAELRDIMKARGVQLSYLPFVIRAAALALRRHRKLNGRLDLENNRFVHQNFVNVGVAVDTPDGLIVPVIKDADRKSVAELAVIISDYAARARERKLTLNEIREGTFTITNYGSIAGTFGVPIINYPEVAILGVGRILQKPVVKDGTIIPGHVLPLSLSADHRIIDGGDVARFLLDIMNALSNPATLLIA